MNDLEKLFEHAPEGAVEIVAWEDGELRYANSEGPWISHAGWVVRATEWQTIATRPQPESAPETFGYDFDAAREKEKAMFDQAIEETAKSIHNPQAENRKTVEDAVEWCKNKYGTTDWVGGGDWSTIWLSDDKEFKWGDIVTSDTICTREEFEVFVAAKSGSEWTHLVNGSECVLLDPEKDCDGYYITKTHYGAFELAKEHELKPIKPTISKAEAWDILMEKKMNSSEVNTLKQKYTITD